MSHTAMVWACDFSEINVKANSKLATPAISGGVMYVRTAQSLFAVGRKK